MIYAIGSSDVRRSSGLKRPGQRWPGRFFIPVYSLVHPVVCIRCGLFAVTGCQQVVILVSDA
jgi:hypothetical protein